MKPRDFLWLASLLAVAAFIWLRDCSWISSADEVLPLLAAPAVFLWLGAPWHGWRNESASVNLRLWSVAAAIFLAGIVLEITFLLALGWTLAMWSWLQRQASPEKNAVVRRLLIFPLLAFPWLALDLPSLGWWFRLSAAWSAAQLFHCLGLAVTREGTQIVVENFPVDVSAACAGLKVLQAMLVAGGLLAFVQLGRSRWYWPAVAMLPLIAWLANTLRVVMLSTVALTFGADAASGWFHEWGGWLVLMVMFGLCGLGFAFLGGTPVKSVPRK
ncbi:MAG: exosortase/archaeosortase family protein [Verrucomicrobiota bacterium]